MIDEKRVRRMVRMSVYEESKGASDQRITSYFRGDYLTRQILITFFCTSAAFLIMAAMAAVYYFETLIVEIYSMDLKAFAGRILMLYLALTGGMIAVTVVVYMLRYRRARRHISALYHDLSVLAAENVREPGH